MSRLLRSLIAVTSSFLLLLVASCSSGLDSSATPNTNIAPMYTYRVINAYPHDHDAFTQGLVFDNGVIYESTGLYGRSSLREVELETGRILQIRDLHEQYVGEGITIRVFLGGVGCPSQKRQFFKVGEAIAIRVFL